jgi:hypothetical protein
MNNICRVLSDYQESTYERLIEKSYVKNYLNSFVYFDEFQKFKEDENYRFLLNKTLSLFIKNKLKLKGIHLN